MMQVLDLDRWPLDVLGEARGQVSPDGNESLRGSDSSNLYCLFQVPRPREVEGQLHGEPGFGR